MKFEPEIQIEYKEPRIMELRTQNNFTAISLQGWLEKCGIKEMGEAKWPCCSLSACQEKVMMTPTRES